MSMTYEAYKDEMKRLIKAPSSYDLREARRAGEMEDAFPDHAARFDTESASREFWN